jgi:hypothetical protein
MLSKFERTTVNEYIKKEQKKLQCRQSEQNTSNGRRFIHPANWNKIYAGIPVCLPRNTSTLKIAKDILNSVAIPNPLS